VQYKTCKNYKKVSSENILKVVKGLMKKNSGDKTTGKSGVDLNILFLIFFLYLYLLILILTY